MEWGSIYGVPVIEREGRWPLRFEDLDSSTRRRVVSHFVQLANLYEHGYMNDKAGDIDAALNRLEAYIAGS